MKPPREGFDENAMTVGLGIAVMSLVPLIVERLAELSEDPSACVIRLRRQAAETARFLTKEENITTQAYREQALGVLRNIFYGVTTEGARLEPGDTL